MLTNPTIETLKSLKLQGMIQALEEQQQNAAVNALSFEERISLVVDRERPKQAPFTHACVYMVGNVNGGELRTQFA